MIPDRSGDHCCCCNGVAACTQDTVDGENARALSSAPVQSPGDSATSTLTIDVREPAVPAMRMLMYADDTVLPDCSTPEMLNRSAARCSVGFVGMVLTPSSRPSVPGAHSVVVEVVLYCHVNAPERSAAVCASLYMATGEHVAAHCASAHCASDMERAAQSAAKAGAETCMVRAWLYREGRGALVMYALTDKKM